MVPGGSDFSPVQFQNSINSPREHVCGVLIKWRVEVLLGSRAVLPDDITRVKPDRHQLPDEREER